MNSQNNFVSSKKNFNRSVLFSFVFDPHQVLHSVHQTKSTNSHNRKHKKRTPVYKLNRYFLFFDRKIQNVPLTRFEFCDKLVQSSKDDVLYCNSDFSRAYNTVSWWKLVYVSHYLEKKPTNNQSILVLNENSIMTYMALMKSFSIVDSNYWPSHFD